MLLAFGIAWACLATTWGVRALWPVRRALGKLRRAELASGLTGLVVLAAVGQHGPAGYVATGCFIGALLCAILAGFIAARSRRSLFRYRRGRLPGSHLHLWVDALAAAVTAGAVGHAAGDAMPICLLVPVTLAVVTAAGQSFKLERRKEAGLCASARAPRRPLAGVPERAAAGGPSEPSASP